MQSVPVERHLSALAPRLGALCLLSSPGYRGGVFSPGLMSQPVQGEMSLQQCDLQRPQEQLKKPSEVIYCALSELRFASCSKYL